MKERPILFSGPMVRAILEGRKTQTRRVVKNAHVITCDDRVGVTDTPCPYGVPGDRLWVKETWCAGRAAPIYRASGCDDKPSANTDDWNAPAVDRWIPSIHMPRRVSRITLEVVRVRVERVATISNADAIAEGVQTEADHYGNPSLGSVAWHRYNADAYSAMSSAESYMTLWESINGKGSWKANPWVWVVEFKRVNA